nr:hypothetical protein Iba_chr09eCG13920 [Ipomoea batatas]
MTESGDPLGSTAAPIRTTPQQLRRDSRRGRRTGEKGKDRWRRLHRTREGKPLPKVFIVVALPDSKTIASGTGRSRRRRLLSPPRPLESRSLPTAAASFDDDVAWWIAAAGASPSRAVRGEEAGSLSLPSVLAGAALPTKEKVTSERSCCRRGYL